MLGTPSYMSPEQARGGSVDPPSDIFSLGSVVYFAATGQAPFGGGIPAALLYRIVFDEPSLDGLPPQLRSLVAACLDKNPATRPTPAQLATALMPAMPGGDQLTPSRVAFWPEPVERFINDYRARLDQGARASAAGRPPRGRPRAGGRPGGSRPLASRLTAGPPPVSGATTAQQRPAGGRHARETGPAAGMNRRRALAALAGAATAGLGIAGWELDTRIAVGARRWQAVRQPVQPAEGRAGQAGLAVQREGPGVVGRAGRERGVRGDQRERHIRGQRDHRQADLEAHDDH